METAGEPRGVIRSFIFSDEGRCTGTTTTPATISGSITLCWRASRTTSGTSSTTRATCQSTFQGMRSQKGDGGRIKRSLPPNSMQGLRAPTVPHQARASSTTGADYHGHGKMRAPLGHLEGFEWFCPHQDLPDLWIQGTLQAGAHAQHRWSSAVTADHGTKGTSCRRHRAWKRPGLAYPGHLRPADTAAGLRYGPHCASGEAAR